MRLHLTVEFLVGCPLKVQDEVYSLRQHGLGHCLQGANVLEKFDLVLVPSEYVDMKGGYHQYLALLDLPRTLLALLTELGREQYHL